MSERILIVDLCGTIVRENTTHGFLLYPEFPLFRRFWVRFVLSRVVTFALSRTCPGAQRKLLIRSLTGLPKMALRQIAEKYAKASLDMSARKSVLARIHEHKTSGGTVLLASASLDFIVETFAEELGCSGAIATELFYDAEGNCLGRIRRDATGCKLFRLRERYLNEQFQFDAITDNPEDLDLKEGATDFWFVEDYVS